MCKHWEEMHKNANNEGSLGGGGVMGDFEFFLYVFMHFYLSAMNMYVLLIKLERKHKCHQK